MNGGGMICSFILSFCQSRYGEEEKKRERDVNAIDGYSKCELVVAKISKDKVERWWPLIMIHFVTKSWE